MRTRLLPLILLLAACSEDPGGLQGDLEACAFGRALTLDPGDVVPDVGVEGVCIQAGEDGDYVLATYLDLPPDTALRAEFALLSGGTGPVSAALAGGIPRAVASAEPGGVSFPGGAPLFEGFPGRVDATDAGGGLLGGPPDRTLHDLLRRREQAELAPLLRPRPGAGAADAPPSAPFRSRTPVPDPGDFLQLSVSASCTLSDPRQGRVVGVTPRSIIVADTERPSGGYSDQDLLTVAGRFESLVYPTLTDAFGAGSDVDGNDRVILFFTPGVNALSRSGLGVVAGFFWGGDLFPAVETPRLGACPASNQAEVLYLAVPDPAGTVGNSVSLDFLRQTVVGTVGHEFQHLLNTGRRLHVNQADRLEETWLNEGLSHMAEELLFFQASGAPRGADLDPVAVTATPRVREAFNEFAVGNLGRFNLYIQNPGAFSLFGRDGLETRGATWSFLRYVVDRPEVDEGVLLRRLMDGPQAGIGNLTAALGRDPADLMFEWSVSVAADGLGRPGDRFQQSSWNLPALISALRLDGRYPLAVSQLTPGTGLLVTLRTGSVVFPAFGVAAGERAFLRLEAQGAVPVRNVRTALMRVR